MKYEWYEGPECGADIPVDAEAWSLYSDMRGVAGAARRLTRVLKKAIKASNREEAIVIMSFARGLEDADRNYEKIIRIEEEEK